LGAVLGISAVSATFSCSFPAFGLGLGCCLGNFCDFSYFLPGLFRLLGWVWGAVWGISAVSATFFLIFSDFLAGFGGAVLGISAVSAPQDPLAMLSTYGYCTL